MASRRKKTKDARVAEVAEGLCATFEGMDECMFALLSEMAKTYAWFAVSCDDLMADLDREGLLVPGLHGDKENPKVGVLHKMSARKMEYFAKIQTARNREMQSAESESDALMDFVKAR